MTDENQLGSLCAPLYSLPGRDTSDEYCVVARCTIPSSVPTKKRLSSSGLNVKALDIKDIQGVPANMNLGVWRPIYSFSKKRKKCKRLLTEDRERESKKSFHDKRCSISLFQLRCIFNPCPASFRKKIGKSFSVPRSFALFNISF